MARKSKFSDAQIIAAIKEVEAGTTAKDVARKMGASYETFNRWKAKYGGLTVSDAARLRFATACSRRATAKPSRPLR